RSSFFFQAEDGIRAFHVTGVQTCALPIFHAEAVTTVSRAAADLGVATYAVVASPLPGPSGNVEYFLALRRDHPEALGPDDLAARSEERRVGKEGRTRG